MQAIMTDSAAAPDTELTEALASADGRASIYREASRRYHAGQYDDASKVFALLVRADPVSLNYLLGSAACALAQKRYLDALLVYSAALLLSPTDARPPLHAAECFVALGQDSEARECLGHALTLLRACPSAQPLLMRALALEQRMAAMASNKKKPARARATL